MSQERIAKVYAQALLQLSQENKETDAIEEEFSGVVSMFQAEASLWQFFLSPLVKTDDKEKTLVKALKTAVSATFLQFVGLLVRKNRFSQLFEIYEQFKLELDVLKNRGFLRIVSSEPLSTAEKTKIVDSITKKFGKELRIQEQIDSSLIGGFRLYVDDYLVDASIRHKLDQIEENLLQKRFSTGAMYEN